MATKPLVINSDRSPNPDISKNWIPMTPSGYSDFVKNINTQIGDNDSIGSVSSVISGMPTLFARADMFEIAFQYSATSSNSNGLNKFYNYLISEWRGLISCIALNPEKISVKRINLSYTDDKNIFSNPQNIFEFKGSVGNILFNRKELWKSTSDKNEAPFIDVILYTKNDNTQVVVGANSPYSLFFTASNYNIRDEDQRYVSLSENKTTGKFLDPLILNKITVSDVKKIKNYVDLILDDNKIQNFQNFYSKISNDNSLSYLNLINSLNKWRKELDEYLKENNFNTEEKGDTSQVDKFKTPFDIVLNNKVNLYGFDGIVSTQKQEGNINSIPFEPNELLAKEDTYVASVDDEGDSNFLMNSPIILLKAKKKGDPSKFKHYSLPITPKGLMLFGKNLEVILDQDNKNPNIKSSINAYFEQDIVKKIELLHVKLTIESDDGKTYLSEKKYKVVSESIRNKEVIVWPNFVSDKWERYFLYSEMPHNSPFWKAVPFCAELNSDGETNIILDEYNKEQPLYLAEDCKVNLSAQAKLHIERSINITSTSDYEYEIFETKNPIKGLNLFFESKPVGFILIKHSFIKTDSGVEIINENQVSNLNKVTIGIDFGSTNSAVAFSDGINKASGITFKNRRRSLFRNDNKNNDLFTSGEDEVFFFQNDIVEGNELKSVLTTHDKNRLSKTDGNFDDKEFGQAVKGGFPCFEKNLPIEERTDNTYLLSFGIQSNRSNATLFHNMKWDDSGVDKKVSVNNRKAFLSSLLLEIYAEMFADRKFPEKLKWSFPSSMISDSNLFGSYQNMWSDLKDLNPLKNKSDYALQISNRQFRDVNIPGIFDTPASSSNNVSNDFVMPSILSGSEPVQQSTKEFDDTRLEVDEKDFKFKELVNNDSLLSLTESEAVANYIASNSKFKKNENVITLCFDIGGSTTDIMVLTKMKPNKNSFDAELCMVKQSSIKFAAQKISHSSKYSKNFKDALIETCKRLNIKIQGLNTGESKFNSNTAPYYFEQIVDRLKPDQFNDFYKLLGTDCKDIFSVNLFVTGLIVFYAGQIAKKVKFQIDSSSLRSDEWDGKPTFQIIYTGKGSRIMDWLNAIDPKVSEDYYLNIFLKGFGLDDAKVHIDWSKHNPNMGEHAVSFVDRTQYSYDIKYEVAKGLAASTNNEKIFTIDTEDMPLEILGEDNFYLKVNGTKQALSSDDYISGQMIEMIGQKFILNPQNNQEPCPKFKIFAEYYFGVAVKYFDLDITVDEFKKGLFSMNIVDYIRQLPDFKRAVVDKRENKNNEDGFNFVSPILILEGINFFENIILENLKSKQ